MSAASPRDRYVRRWLPLIRARLSGFWRGDSGSITLEFVLWVPMLIYIGAAMFALSHYLATAAEVQQVANELVRASVSRMNQSDSEICASLQEEVLPRVVQTMTLVRQNRFQPFASTGCRRDGADFLIVTVTYDLSGTPAHHLGRMIGLSFVTMRRMSMVQL